MGVLKPNPMTLTKIEEVVVEFRTGGDEVSRNDIINLRLEVISVPRSHTLIGI